MSAWMNIARGTTRRARSTWTPETSAPAAPGPCSTCASTPLAPIRTPDARKRRPGQLAKFFEPGAVGLDALGGRRARYPVVVALLDGDAVNVDVGSPSSGEPGDLEPTFASGFRGFAHLDERATRQLTHRKVRAGAG